ncbi:MAG: hypothetical protein HUU55_16690 [Myxococcales bacterium]|nr:hypothetical protein [Myxococcales bacterium]
MYNQNVLSQLVVSTHDLSLIKSFVNSLPPDDTWTKTGIESANDLKISQDNLIKAAKDDVRERNETTDARAKLYIALTALTTWHHYAYGHAKQKLTNPNPDAQLSPEDIEANQKKFDRIFKHTPSQLANLGVGNAIEIVVAVFDTLKSVPELKELADSLTGKKAVNDAPAALALLERETNEDREAIERVVRASLEHAKNQRLYELAVTGILTKADRPHELGKWLLEKDPAYRARRNAKKPVTEEETAQTIMEEIGSPPVDAPPAPTP